LSTFYPYLAEMIQLDSYFPNGTNHHQLEKPSIFGGKELSSRSFERFGGASYMIGTLQATCLVRKIMLKLDDSFVSFVAFG